MANLESFQKQNPKPKTKNWTKVVQKITEISAIEKFDFGTYFFQRCTG